MILILNASSPPLGDCCAFTCRAPAGHLPGTCRAVDSACGSGPMLGWRVGRKINPHIPVLDKAGRTDGTWSRADFEGDAANDQYICPEGESLKPFRRNASDPNRGPDGKGVAKYRGQKRTCQAGPSQANCGPDADFRSITREEHEDARQVARDIAKTKSQ